MKSKFFVILLICFCITHTLVSQEIKANVVVNANLIPSTVERDIFLSLQNDLNNFLNNSKWTTLSFESHEKIECNFFLNLKSIREDNVYNASLIVQAKRPIYGTDYTSTLLNQSDDDFTFSYIKNQFVDFNEFRVQGNDPLIANLTAIFAYYVYMILGIDFDSYSLKGGLKYFEKAFFIANNSPQKAGYIAGWESRGKRTNRFWMAENFFTANYNLMHDVIYLYYRKGMDILIENPVLAKQNILSALDKTYTIFKTYPGAVISTMFIQPRTEEILNLFASAEKKDKEKVSKILRSIDLPNRNIIKQRLE